MLGIWQSAFYGALMSGVLIAERLSPLRRRVEPQRDRLPRNAVIAGLTAVVTNAAETLIVMPLAKRVEDGRRGWLFVTRLPEPVRRAVGFLLLDYTLFVWHRLNHQVPVLWRFHLVHHVDLDLDASTGIRFHFGEMLLSTIFRAGQVRLFGIGPGTLATWSRLLLASVIFHHSNLRLPLRLERLLTLIVVTPRMHGVHHSIVRRETDSNFSSLLSWWDLLHGSLRLNVPQRAITIGVPAYQSPDDVTLPRVLALPLVEQRDDWRLPGGWTPEREPLPGDPGELAG
jgi:sterol desaturase/sphingolipid hydroxylase (fatty acid hydroxylase superfamily)